MSAPACVQRGAAPPPPLAGATPRALRVGPPLTSACTLPQKRYRGASRPVLPAAAAAPLLPWQARGVARPRRSQPALPAVATAAASTPRSAGENAAGTLQFVLQAVK
eukprot:231307-Chlamydomonas_euryale.AAC.2